MKIEEIVFAINAIEHKEIAFEESLLKKDSTELSLQEANSIMKATGVSLDFLLTGETSNHLDKEIVRYFEYMKIKKAWEEKRSKMTEEITNSINNAISTWDFILTDGRINGLKLLSMNDFELFEFVSANYELAPFSNSRYQLTDWESVREIISSRIGNELTDYRFAKYCISNPNIATETLNRLDKDGFDSSKDNLLSIIMLIDNGALLYPHVSVSGDASMESRPSYFQTQMLKDYCLRKIETIGKNQ